MEWGRGIYEHDLIALPTLGNVFGKELFFSGDVFEVSLTFNGF